MLEGVFKRLVCRLFGGDPDKSIWDDERIIIKDNEDIRLIAISDRFDLIAINDRFGIVNLMTILCPQCRANYLVDNRMPLNIIDTKFKSYITLDCKNNPIDLTLYQICAMCHDRVSNIECKEDEDGEDYKSQCQELIQIAVSELGWDRYNAN